MGEAASKTASFKKRELQAEALRSRLEGDLHAAEKSLDDLLKVCCEASGLATVDALHESLLKNPEAASIDERLEVAFLLDALGNVLRGIEQEDQGAAKAPASTEEEKANETTAANGAGPSALAQGATSLALKRIEQGLALRKAAHETDASNERLKITLARSYSSLAMYYHGRRMQEEADKAHLEALNLFADVPLHSTARTTKPPSPAAASASFPSSADAQGKASPDAGPGATATEIENGHSGAALEEAVKQKLSWKDFRDQRLKLLQAKVKAHILRAHQNLHKQEASGADEDNGVREHPAFASVAHGVQRVVAQAQRSQNAPIGANDDGRSRNNAKGGHRTRMLSGGESSDPRHTRCRLVLLRRDVAPAGCATLEPLLMTGEGELAKRAGEQATSLDSTDEHIPEVIDLDPDTQELIHLGRQTYGDALGFFQSRLETTRHRIGFVRLDSTQHDRLISRRHAQLKFSKVHGLLATALGQTGTVKEALPMRGMQEDEENKQGNAESVDVRSQVSQKADTSAVDKADADPEAEGGVFHTALSSAGESAEPATAAPGSAPPPPTLRDRRRVGPDELAWVIRDLDSTNGILVNGVRVQEYPLRHGDIVSFGGATSVPFGCAVLTHKRRPVTSVFVYRFEVLDAQGPWQGKPYGSMTAEWMPAPSTVASQLDPLVEVFYLERSRSRDAADAAAGSASDMESFHFFVLYICAHPENIPEDDAQIRKQLVESIRAANLLHRKAVELDIPFSHWASWIRAQALSRPM